MNAFASKYANLVRRDECGIAHIVGVSGGKDSTCLAVALKEREPRPYTYIYTPTGDELPPMKEHMRRLEELLGQPIIELTNGTLASVIEQNRMIPNCHARFCTRLLKLKPAGWFYEAMAPVVAYVGLRDDEDEREGTRPGGDSASLMARVSHDYPFQRWGWGIEEVWGFLDERGICIPERTDCARCPYQRLGEWWNLWHDYPHLFASAEADEARWGHTYRSDQRDSWPASLAQLRARFEAGLIPERSLRMMEKRRGMCRACSM
jgi:3'-phosphoadenosine 5'-phosphosulfate sulfotransferase (PAPS reductase)/FAD synthetase